MSNSIARDNFLFEEQLFFIALPLLVGMIFLFHHCVYAPIKLQDFQPQDIGCVSKIIIIYIIYLIQCYGCRSINYFVN